MEDLKQYTSAIRRARFFFALFVTFELFCAVTEFFASGWSIWLFLLLGFALWIGYKWQKTENAYRIVREHLKQ